MPTAGTVFEHQLWITSAAFLPALAFWIIASASLIVTSVATTSPLDFLITVTRMSAGVFSSAALASVSASSRYISRPPWNAALDARVGVKNCGIRCPKNRLCVIWATLMRLCMRMFICLTPLLRCMYYAAEGTVRQPLLHFWLIVLAELLGYLLDTLFRKARLDELHTKAPVLVLHVESHFATVQLLHVGLRQQGNHCAATRIDDHAIILPVACIGDLCSEVGVLARPVLFADRLPIEHACPLKDDLLQLGDDTLVALEIDGIRTGNVCPGRCTSTIETNTTLPLVLDVAEVELVLCLLAQLSQPIVCYGNVFSDHCMLLVAMMLV